MGVKDFAGRRVFITGAASGIGRATALAVARRGGHLHLTDRDDAKLAETVSLVEQVGGTVLSQFPADITDIDAVRELASAIHNLGPAMDVVMNVAGIAAWGTVDTLEHRQWRAMVEVNLMGPIHVIESFVPAMIERGEGGALVNVSSAAGLIGLPWHAAYSASKFGLRGVSEVLRFDLARHGIGVHLVCPGGVATPLTDTVEIAFLDKSSPTYERAHDRFVRRAVSPEQAAEAIVRGVTRGRYLIYTSPDIRLIHTVQRYCPPAYNAVMTVMNKVAERVARKARPGVGA